jgi:hypothetical protein
MATGRVPTTANSPLTAKGDLFGYSTTQARVAVGNDGETLVADSSTSTGLRYQGSLAAGRNFVINGGFDIWQRGTSFTNGAGTSIYGADRWHIYSTDGSGRTWSRQTTSDTTNLPFIQYCLRAARNSGVTSTNSIAITQDFETANSLPFAGKTLTISFYARRGANYSATGNALNVDLVQGTGTDQNSLTGFTGQAPVLSGVATLTTTWQRFSFTGTMAATYTQLGIQIYGLPTGTAGAADFYEITGVQVEVGSVATQFSRSGGTIQGELAACQRYYYRQSIAATPARFGIGMVNSATAANFYTYFPVQMRTAPTALEQNGTATDYSVIGSGVTITVCSAVPIVGSNSVNVAQYAFTVASGLTAGQAIEARPVNTNAYLGWSAEL